MNEGFEKKRCSNCEYVQAVDTSLDDWEITTVCENCKETERFTDVTEESEMLSYIKDKICFYNFKTNSFDSFGADFCFEKHANDDYGEELGNLIRSVLKDNPEAFPGTIVDAEGQLLALIEGVRRVNRLGYVIYKTVDNVDIVYNNGGYYL